MNESTARRRHREANDGAEPEWALVGFKNPNRLWRSFDEYRAWHAAELARRDEVQQQKDLARAERVLSEAHR